jgi:hypothetical protein
MFEFAQYPLCHQPQLGPDTFVFRLANTEILAQAFGCEQFA